jgi:hypothetical protein
MANKLLELPSPILLCVQRSDFENAIINAEVKQLSINLPLARVLYNKANGTKYANITATVLSLIPNNAPIYLTDYEMLFDPRYELDVIKLFCEISRYNKLIIKWCGSFKDDSLIYSEPGYDDYSKYKINDYKIVCVI